MIQVQNSGYFSQMSTLVMAPQWTITSGLAQFISASYDLDNKSKARNFFAGFPVKLALSVANTSNLSRHLSTRVAPSIPDAPTTAPVLPLTHITKIALLQNLHLNLQPMRTATDHLYQVPLLCCRNH